MRAHRGFTLIELMVALVVMMVVAGLVVYQGRSARQAADLAGGSYDVALRLSGLRARAMAEAKDFAIVVVDASDPVGCTQADSVCGRAIVLSDVTSAFTITGFDPDAAITNAAYVEDRRLPKNSQFDLAATWGPPAPFNGVTAWDPSVRATCAGGRACFGLRFRDNGEVTALWPGAAAALPGFAFVLMPVQTLSNAAQRRAFFVSFPTGLVKTAAF
jgi:prepilin-type N-terminal cleavage/methylation domain-containing protein